MPQSLSHVLIHAVFSTKHRDPIIHPPVRPALHSYLGGTLRAIDCPSLKVGGTDDHIHALFVLSRTLTIANVIKEMKQSASIWMKDQGEPAFAWQAGYGAFSVSPSNAQEVIDYIQRQEAHHQHITFQEEFRIFLERHGIAYDERYVWD